MLAVKTLSTPTSDKQIQSFLGFVGYYRRFILHFAQRAAPLYALLQAAKVFHGERTSRQRSHSELETPQQITPREILFLTKENHLQDQHPWDRLSTKDALASPTPALAPPTPTLASPTPTMAPPTPRWQAELLRYLDGLRRGGTRTTEATDYDEEARERPRRRTTTRRHEIERGDGPRRGGTRSSKATNRTEEARNQEGPRLQRRLHKIGLRSARRTT